MKLLDRLDAKINKFFEKTFGEGFERLGKTVEGITDLESSGHSRVSINGSTIEFKNGKLKINGREIPKSEIDDILNNPQTTTVSYTNQNKTIPDGQTYTVEGDFNGNLSLNGNNITIVIEGDLMGNISGASQVIVQGDHIGNS